MRRTGLGRTKAQGLIPFPVRPRRFKPSSINNLINLDIQGTDSRDFDKQTSDTIVKMISIVRANREDELVIAVTKQVLWGLNPLAPAQQKICSIFNWIKRNVKYQDDYSLANEMIGLDGRNPDGEDFLISPRLLLLLPEKKGDCDDFSMLAATMLGIAGFQTKFITVAADSTQPDLFSHVYVKVLDPQLGLWISFDSSHGTNAGWEYPGSTRYKEWMI